MHGLLQTEAYARALMETSPGASDEMVSSRLHARLERQRRVLQRDDPPSAWFIVDQLSLYREVGSAEVMAGQMGYLANAGDAHHVSERETRARRRLHLRLRDDNALDTSPEPVAPR